MCARVRGILISYVDWFTLTVPEDSYIPLSKTYMLILCFCSCDPSKLYLKEYLSFWIFSHGQDKQQIRYKSRSFSKDKKYSVEIYFWSNQKLERKELGEEGDVARYYKNITDVVKGLSSWEKKRPYYFIENG